MKRTEAHEKERQENLKFWGAMISLVVIGGALAWAFDELQNHFLFKGP